MSLWGKTDNLAGMPKFIARKAFFDSTAVSAANDTLDILSSNTGFATGDAVVYDINGGTVIDGLTNATTYYVRVVGAGLIELYDTYNNAINTVATTGRLDIVGAGVGTHTLQRTGAANPFGDQVGNGRQVIFVDAQEAQVDANKAKGLTGAGWWAYRTYTDAQGSTRHKAECLVALSVAAADSGDAEDTIAIDLAIAFSSQPANQSVSVGDDPVFTVVATINGSVPLSYQWQLSTDAGSSWNDIPGATSASYTVTDATLAMDQDQYQVIVSGGGISATSDPATLTVA